MAALSMKKAMRGEESSCPTVLFMPVLLHGTFVMMLCLDVFFGKRMLAVLVCGGVLVVAALCSLAAVRSLELRGGAGGVVLVGSEDPDVV